MDYREWVRSRLKDFPTEFLLNLPEVCLGCEYAFFLPGQDFYENGMPVNVVFVQVDLQFLSFPQAGKFVKVPSVPKYIYRSDLEQKIESQLQLFSFPPMDDQFCKQLKLFWFNDKQIQIGEEDYRSLCSWFCVQEDVYFAVEQAILADFSLGEEAMATVKKILRCGKCLLDDVPGLLGLWF